MSTSRTKATGSVRNEVKYRGQTSFLELIHGKVYDVVSIEKGWYCIVDDSGEDCLYPPDEFAVIEGDDGTVHVSD
jgi:hypothetical protein